MGYVVVVAVAVAVGATVYVVTMRRSAPPDTESFLPPAVEPAPDRIRASDITYVPVASGGARVSWQTRSISLLALVALALVSASAIAVSLYKVGSLLIRVIIHKLQNS